MNSIQHYINQNEKRLANIYLSKFAELMRKILDNSQKRSVSVAEDLSALELYIELQQLRFENKFSYEIVVDDAIDQNNTNIPPLVLQPYVENAISHGILNLPKEKEGKLKVIMTLREDSLICEIEDNGVGRKAAAEVRHQHASHEPAGLQITSERVQYLGGSENSGRVEIIDLVDHGEPAGTMVRIQLPADLN